MPSFSIADHLFLFSVGLSVRRTSSSCPRLIGLLSEKAGTFISNGGINFIQLKDFNTVGGAVIFSQGPFFFQLANSDAPTGPRLRCFVPLIEPILHMNFDQN